MTNLNHSRNTLLIATALMCLVSIAEDTPKPFVNGIGMDMAPVPAGTFAMGSTGGDWDESPVHHVAISQPFNISTREVSLRQFQAFRPEHPWGSSAGIAVAVSWHDAVAFCEWLSGVEGKPYRLPTEAEWEYACRLNGGVAGDYPDAPPMTGDGHAPDPSDTPGALGITGMGNDVPEWCYDWYGPYEAADQIDPIGRDSGMARVVRGNKLDEDSDHMLPHTRGSFYRRSANRAGMAPNFAPQEGPNSFGQHAIGFRVVQAPLPATAPLGAVKEPVFEGVKQETREAARSTGPDAGKPYFRKRYLLPTPPETIEAFSEPDVVTRHRTAIDALAMHPAFCGHNHSPALEVMPNGDLLMVIFTSWNEYEPGMTLMATRLRFGADAWDWPSCFLDIPDACDNTPLLWTDGDTVRMFWSNTRAIGAFPFHWIESRDSGATWSEVHFPRFTNLVGPHSRQPINTVVRDRDGVVYVPSDGDGARSVVWMSNDGLLTWQDPGGRTGGRHTTIALLDDGKSILGMGGKSSDIDGYMPQSISRDGGKTWDVTKTVFPKYGANQRPCVLRLASGRLFFCGDFQHINGASPANITERGALVALSNDDGASWKTKKLPGAQPHENPKQHKGAATLGYSVARQAPDGLIHIITTMNVPCLHFALNEAWILSDEASAGEADLMASAATRIDDVQKHEEQYSDGRLRFVWSAGIADDGRYLLHGPESWFHENGKVKYEAEWNLGHKVGVETCYDTDGNRLWEWNHHDDGTKTWTQWWKTGGMEAQSQWKDTVAHGPAKRGDSQGVRLSDVQFVNGRPE